MDDSLSGASCRVLPLLSVSAAFLFPLSLFLSFSLSLPLAGRREAEGRRASRMMLLLDGS